MFPPHMQRTRWTTVVATPDNRLICKARIFCQPDRPLKESSLLVDLDWSHALTDGASILDSVLGRRTSGFDVLLMASITSRIGDRHKLTYALLNKSQVKCQDSGVTLATRHSPTPTALPCYKSAFAIRSLHLPCRIERQMTQQASYSMRCQTPVASQAKDAALLSSAVRSHEDGPMDTPQPGCLCLHSCCLEQVRRAN